MRRYDGDYRNTYGALRSGRVGEPVLISQRHRNPLAVNNFDAQKLIVNTASRGIDDLFRWLTGEEITGPSAYDGYATNAVADAALSALQEGTGQRVHQVPASTLGCRKCAV